MSALTAQIWNAGACLKTISRKGKPVQYRDLASAIRALERAHRKADYNASGRVFDQQGKLVYSIAL